MNALTVTNHAALALKAGQPARITAPLDNGNMAIIQIVDPEDVPALAKVVRALGDNWLTRRLKAAEAAVRVAGIVYRNAVRKAGQPRKPSKGRAARGKK